MFVNSLTATCKGGPCKGKFDLIHVILKPADYKTVFRRRVAKKKKKKK